MVAGGLLQLVVTGIQDTPLIQNPEITFFKVVYKKYTSFAICQNDKYLGKFKFDSNNIKNIDKNGDLLYNLYFKINIPKFTMIKTDNIINNIINDKFIKQFDIIYNNKYCFIFQYNSIWYVIPKKLLQSFYFNTYKSKLDFSNINNYLLPNIITNNIIYFIDIEDNNILSSFNILLYNSNLIEQYALYLNFNNLNKLLTIKSYHEYLFDKIKNKLYNLYKKNNIKNIIINNTTETERYFTYLNNNNYDILNFDIDIAFKYCNNNLLNFNDYIDNVLIYNPIIIYSTLKMLYANNNLIYTYWKKYSISVYNDVGNEVNNYNSNNEWHYNLSKYINLNINNHILHYYNKLYINCQENIYNNIKNLSLINIKDIYIKLKVIFNHFYTISNNNNYILNFNNNYYTLYNYNTNYNFDTLIKNEYSNYNLLNSLFQYINNNNETSNITPIDLSNIYILIAYDFINITKTLNRSLVSFLIFWKNNITTRLFIKYLNTYNLINKNNLLFDYSYNSNVNDSRKLTLYYTLYPSNQFTTQDFKLSFYELFYKNSFIGSFNISNNIFQKFKENNIKMTIENYNDNKYSFNKLNITNTYYYIYNNILEKYDCFNKYIYNKININNNILSIIYDNYYDINCNIILYYNNIKLEYNDINYDSPNLIFTLYNSISLNNNDVIKLIITFNCSLPLISFYSYGKSYFNKINYNVVNVYNKYNTNYTNIKLSANILKLLTIKYYNTIIPPSFDISIQSNPKNNLKYKYLVAFSNNNYTNFSNIITVNIDSEYNQKIIYLPTSSNPDYSKRLILRTKNIISNNETFYIVDEINDNNITYYIDTRNDSDLITSYSVSSVSYNIELIYNGEGSLPQGNYRYIITVQLNDNKESVPFSYQEIYLAYPGSIIIKWNIPNLNEGDIYYLYRQYENGDYVLIKNTTFTQYNDTNLSTTTNKILPYNLSVYIQYNYRKYCITYYDKNTESNISNIYTAKIINLPLLLNIPKSTQNIIGRKIYRTKINDDKFYLIANIENNIDEIFMDAIDDNDIYIPLPNITNITNKNYININNITHINNYLYDITKKYDQENINSIDIEELNINIKIFDNFYIKNGIVNTNFEYNYNYLYYLIDKYNNLNCTKLIPFKRYVPFDDVPFSLKLSNTTDYNNSSIYYYKISYYNSINYIESIPSESISIKSNINNPIIILINQKIYDNNYDSWVIYRSSDNINFYFLTNLFGYKYIDKLEQLNKPYNNSQFYISNELNNNLFNKPNKPKLYLIDNNLSLLLGTYKYKITYYSDNNESIPSDEESIVINTNQCVKIFFDIKLTDKYYKIYRAYNSDDYNLLVTTDSEYYIDNNNIINYKPDFNLTINDVNSSLINGEYKYKIIYYQIINNISYESMLSDEKYITVNNQSIKIELNNLPINTFYKIYRAFNSDNFYLLNESNNVIYIDNLNIKNIIPNAPIISKIYNINNIVSPINNTLNYKISYYFNYDSIDYESSTSNYTTVTINENQAVEIILPDYTIPNNYDIYYKIYRQYNSDNYLLLDITNSKKYIDNIDIIDINPIFNIIDSTELSLEYGTYKYKINYNINSNNYQTIESNNIIINENNKCIKITLTYPLISNVYCKIFRSYNQQDYILLNVTQDNMYIDNNFNFNTNKPNTPILNLIPNDLILLNGTYKYKISYYYSTSSISYESLACESSPIIVTDNQLVEIQLEQLPTDLYYKIYRSYNFGSYQLLDIINTNNYIDNNYIINIKSYPPLLSTFDDNNSTLLPGLYKYRISYYYSINTNKYESISSDEILIEINNNQSIKLKLPYYYIPNIHNYYYKIYRAYNSNQYELLTIINTDIFIDSNNDNISPGKPIIENINDKINNNQLIVNKLSDKLYLSKYVIYQIPINNITPDIDYFISHSSDCYLINDKKLSDINDYIFNKPFIMFMSDDNNKINDFISLDNKYDNKYISYNNYLCTFNNENLYFYNINFKLNDTSIIKLNDHDVSYILPLSTQQFFKNTSKFYINDTLNNASKSQIIQNYFNPSFDDFNINISFFKENKYSYEFVNELLTKFKNIMNNNSDYINIINTIDIINNSYTDIFKNLFNNKDLYGITSNNILEQIEILNYNNLDYDIYSHYALSNNYLSKNNNNTITNLYTAYNANDKISSTLENKLINMSNFYKSHIKYINDNIKYLDICNSNNYEEEYISYNKLNKYITKHICNYQDKIIISLLHPINNNNIHKIQIEDKYIDDYEIQNNKIITSNYDKIIPEENYNEYLIIMNKNKCSYNGICSIRQNKFYNIHNTFQKIKINNKIYDYINDKLITNNTDILNNCIYLNPKDELDNILLPIKITNGKIITIINDINIDDNIILFNPINNLFYFNKFNDIIPDGNYHYYIYSDLELIECTINNILTFSFYKIVYNDNSEKIYYYTNDNFNDLINIPNKQYIKIFLINNDIFGTNYNQFIKNSQNYFSTFKDELSTTQIICNLNHHSILNIKPTFKLVNKINNDNYYYISNLNKILLKNEIDIDIFTNSVYSTEYPVFIYNQIYNIVSNNNKLNIICQYNYLDSGEIIIINNTYYYINYLIDVINQTNYLYDVTILRSLNEINNFPCDGYFTLGIIINKNINIPDIYYNDINLFNPVILTYGLPQNYGELYLDPETYKFKIYLDSNIITNKVFIFDKKPFNVELYIYDSKLYLIDCFIKLKINDFIIFENIIYKIINIRDNEILLDKQINTHLSKIIVKIPYQPFTNKYMIFPNNNLKNDTIIEYNDEIYIIKNNNAFLLKNFDKLITNDYIWVKILNTDYSSYYNYSHEQYYNNLAQYPIQIYKNINNNKIEIDNDIIELFYFFQPLYINGTFNRIKRIYDNKIELMNNYYNKDNVKIILSPFYINKYNYYINRKILYNFKINVNYDDNFLVIRYILKSDKLIYVDKEYNFRYGISIINNEYDNNIINNEYTSLYFHNYKLVNVDGTISDYNLTINSYHLLVKKNNSENLNYIYLIKLISNNKFKLYSDELFFDDLSQCIFYLDNIFDCKIDNNYNISINPIKIVLQKPLISYNYDSIKIIKKYKITLSSPIFVLDNYNQIITFNDDNNDFNNLLNCKNINYNDINTLLKYDNYYKIVYSENLLDKYYIIKNDNDFILISLIKTYKNIKYIYTIDTNWITSSIKNYTYDNNEITNILLDQVYDIHNFNIIISNNSLYNNYYYKLIDNNNIDVFANYDINLIKINNINIYKIIDNNIIFDNNSISESFNNKISNVSKFIKNDNKNIKDIYYFPTVEDIIIKCINNINIDIGIIYNICKPWDIWSLLSGNYYKNQKIYLKYDNDQIKIINDDLIEYDYLSPIEIYNLSIFLKLMNNNELRNMYNDIKIIEENIFNILNIWLENPYFYLDTLNIINKFIWNSGYIDYYFDGNNIIHTNILPTYIDDSIELATYITNEYKYDNNIVYRIKNKINENIDNFMNKNTNNNYGVSIHKLLRYLVNLNNELNNFINNLRINSNDIPYYIYNNPCKFIINKLWNNINYIGLNKDHNDIIQMIFNNIANDNIIFSNSFTLNYTGNLSLYYNAEYNVDIDHNFHNAILTKIITSSLYNYSIIYQTNEFRKDTIYDVYNINKLNIDKNFTINNPFIYCNELQFTSNININSNDIIVIQENNYFNIINTEFIGYLYELELNNINTDLIDFVYYNDNKLNILEKKQSSIIITTISNLQNNILIDLRYNISIKNINYQDNKYILTFYNNNFYYNNDNTIINIGEYNYKLYYNNENYYINNNINIFDKCYISTTIFINNIINYNKLLYIHTIDTNYNFDLYLSKNDFSVYYNKTKIIDPSDIKLIDNNTIIFYYNTIFKNGNIIKYTKYVGEKFKSKIISLNNYTSDYNHLLYNTPSITNNKIIIYDGLEYIKLNKLLMNNTSITSIYYIDYIFNFTTNTDIYVSDSNNTIIKALHYYHNDNKTCIIINNTIDITDFNFFQIMSWTVKIIKVNNIIKILKPIDFNYNDTCYYTIDNIIITNININEDYIELENLELNNNVILRQYYKNDNLKLFEYNNTDDQIIIYDGIKYLDSNKLIKLNADFIVFYINILLPMENNTSYYISNEINLIQVIDYYILNDYTYFIVNTDNLNISNYKLYKITTYEISIIQINKIIDNRLHKINLIHKSNFNIDQNTYYSINNNIIELKLQDDYIIIEDIILDIDVSIITENNIIINEIIIINNKLISYKILNYIDDKIIDNQILKKYTKYDSINIVNNLINPYNNYIVPSINNDKIIIYDGFNYLQYNNLIDYENSNMYVYYIDDIINFTDNTIIYLSDCENNIINAKNFYQSNNKTYFFINIEDVQNYKYFQVMSWVINDVIEINNIIKIKMPMDFIFDTNKYYYTINNKILNNIIIDDEYIIINEIIDDMFIVLRQYYQNDDIRIPENKYIYKIKTERIIEYIDPDSNFYIIPFNYTYSIKCEYYQQENLNYIYLILDENSIKLLNSNTDYYFASYSKYNIINYNNKLIERTPNMTQSIMKKIVSNVTILNPKWKPCYTFFDYIKIFFNDQLIEELNADIYNIHYNLYLNEQKKYQFDKMINVYETNKYYEFYLPLLFWFCNKSSLSLPIIALPYTDIKLNFKLNSIENLISNYSNNIKFNIEPSIKITLISDIIFLNNTERLLFSSYYHEYIINRYKLYNENTIYNKNEIVNKYFTGLVKDIYIITKPINSNYNYFYKKKLIYDSKYEQYINVLEYYNNKKVDRNYENDIKILSNILEEYNNNLLYNDNQRIIRLKYNFNPNDELLKYLMYYEDKYLNNISDSRKNYLLLIYLKYNFINSEEIEKISPINSMNIKVNGMDLFSSNDWTYYTYLIPTQKYNTILPIGYYVYTFSLYPLDEQYSGHLNFTNFDTTTLLINSNDLINNNPYKINVICKEYNILRIMSGIGGLGWL